MTNQTNECIEYISNFLGAVFHQDINSPDEALEETIQENDPETLKQISYCINVFLESNLPVKEKNTIIENETWIDFSSIGQKPIEWLKDVQGRLKNAT